MQRRQFIQTGAMAALALLQRSGAAQNKAAGDAVKKRRVLVWTEGALPSDPKTYPLLQTLSKLRNYDVQIAALSLTEPDQGLSDTVLAQTDVLVWWGRDGRENMDEVKDATVERMVKRVTEGGMGFVGLHLRHFTKPLKSVLNSGGGNWTLYYNDGKPEPLRVALPNHPIARGVRAFTFPQGERYSEPQMDAPPGIVPFDTPPNVGEQGEQKGKRTPLGLCWTRGNGRVFYLRPGRDEAAFQMPEMQRIVRNAVLWAANDEAGIWEDADPFARNARATGEPPLALILSRLGYGGTDITKPGEVIAPRFVKASVGTVKTYPLASFGLIKDLTAGWYSEPASPTDTPQFAPLWKVEAKYNKQDAPPLANGAVTEFEPGAAPFGLWVSTAGFTNEMVCTGDNHNATIKRFGGKPIRKARVYQAVKSDYATVPNAYIIGWEYSTNDDFQDIVTLVENVRPA